jgi:integrase
MSEQSNNQSLETTGQKSKAVGRYNEVALQKLEDRLTSPRLRAPGTLETYMETAKRFFNYIKKQTPGDEDFRRYFKWRRDHDIAESTLRKEYFHLQKLCQANNFVFPFQKDDTPFSQEKPYQPVFTLKQIEQLINAQKDFSEAERFYLSTSTVYACRREALAQIKKRDYDAETILIHGVHRGLPVKHLIPDVLKPIYEEYRPSVHSPDSLTMMFQRIMKKAGLEVEKGFGFHSIRRALDSEAEYFLAEHRLPASLWADYVGWSKTTKGSRFMGAAMAGVYSHPEIRFNDPFYLDELIFPIHPCIKMWEKTTHFKHTRSLPKAEANKD